MFAHKVQDKHAEKHAGAAVVRYSVHTLRCTYTHWLHVHMCRYARVGGETTANDAHQIASKGSDAHTCHLLLSPHPTRVKHFPHPAENLCFSPPVPLRLM